MNLALFYVWEESVLTEIIPLMCTSAIWGQYPIPSHPESPQGAALGTAAVAKGLAAGSRAAHLSPP